MILSWIAEDQNADSNAFTSTSWPTMGDVFSLTLSPVEDANAFAQAIDFGRVQSIADKKIKLVIDDPGSIRLTDEQAVSMAFVVIEGDVDDAASDMVLDKLSEIGKTQPGAWSVNVTGFDVLTATVGPVHDVDAFAKKIKLGQVLISKGASSK